jgi:hypothetical protein
MDIFLSILALKSLNGIASRKKDKGKWKMGNENRFLGSCLFAKAIF